MRQRDLFPDDLHCLRIDRLDGQDVFLPVFRSHPDVTAKAITPDHRYCFPEGKTASTVRAFSLRLQIDRAFRKGSELNADIRRHIITRVL